MLSRTRRLHCSKRIDNFARTISRHADGISRYSVPPSAGPLLPLRPLQQITWSYWPTGEGPYPPSASSSVKARDSRQRNSMHLMWSVSALPSVLWRCWLGGSKGIRPVKTEWWGAGVVICLERGADLHMAQLMPLPLTVSCFSKIQFGFTFLVPAYPGSPGQGPLNGGVCVCVCVCVSVAALCH